MRTNWWETLLGILFLVLCLIGGLALSEQTAPKPVIGVLRFAGVIDFDTADYLINVLDVARKDDSVAGVVMEILSPGGYSTSSESIYYSMLRLRDEKPLVVYVDGLAASGGYYMAVAGNRIYAPPSANLGNVGARSMQPEDPVLFPDELSTGPYKLSGGSRFDSIRQLELVRDSFLGNVVQQRQNAAVNPLNIPPEEVGEARLYLGSEAVAVGLADLAGGRSDAILGAAELAGITDYDVVDLAEHEGVEPPQPIGVSFAAQAAALAQQAPPETVFLLDNRIPLAHSLSASQVEAHLLSLRDADMNPVSSATQNQAAPPAFLKHILPAGDALQ